MSVNQKDYNKVLTALSQIEDAQLRDLFTRIGGVLVNDFRLGFKKSTAPDGSKWAPIKHRAGQPLRDTGRLRNSITHNITGKTLEVGTNVTYAPVQHFGGKSMMQVPEHTKVINQAFGKPITPKTVKVKAHAKKQGVKARPFLGIEKRQRSKIVSTYQKWLGTLTGGEATPA